jgi:hypothetical protein
LRSLFTKFQRPRGPPQAGNVGATVFQPNFNAGGSYDWSIWAYFQ